MQEILKGIECLLRVNIASVGAVQNAVKIDTHLISPSGVSTCISNGYDELAKTVEMIISGDLLNELGAYSIDMRLVFAGGAIVVPTFAFAEVVASVDSCDMYSIVDITIKAGEVEPDTPTPTINVVGREEFEVLSSEVRTAIIEAEKATKDAIESSKGATEATSSAVLATANAYNATSDAQKATSQATVAKEAAENATEQAKVATASAKIAAKSAEEAAKRADEATNKLDLLIPITYSELVALLNESKLKAGAFYRITDYQCTTIQEDSRSAGHQFDIIVQALDERTLSENAQAIQHDGDTYFADAKLEAWQLKYAIDNDTTRFSWAQEEVIEQPARWSCGWGVLEEGYSNNSSEDYEEADIDSEHKYLYRPLQPTSYLEGKEFYRNAIIGTITSPDGFIYEAEYYPWEDGYDENDNPMYNWSDVYEISVKTADGQLVATLVQDYDGTFYDAEYGDPSLGLITFDTSTEYDDESGMYRYTPIDGVTDWFENARGGAITKYGKELYKGSVNDLYYAFDNHLQKSTTDVRVVTDRVHLYYYADTNYEEWEGEYSLIDTVTYEAYVEGKEEGKGVIYRMIDEHNNDCPYDFKNMQFLHDGAWYYTFTYRGEDLSITDYCSGNYIMPFAYNKSVLTPCVVSLPVLVFNLTMRGDNGASTVGVFDNKFHVKVAKGFISSSAIYDNTWDENKYDNNITELYIKATNLIYANRFTGAAKKFIIGDANATLNFFANKVDLPSVPTYDVQMNGTLYYRNTFNLLNAAGAFYSPSGSLADNYIEDNGGSGDGSVIFDVTTYLSSSRILLSRNLTLQYGSTTSSSLPLRFLNIDARDWSASTIAIPSTFPANANYELKVAKSSKGEIKMWCEADLIQ